MDDALLNSDPNFMKSGFVSKDGPDSFNQKVMDDLSASYYIDMS